jgi:DNA polymerase-3 subunit alpha
MPDIDMDFCDDRRGEIIDYVIKRYGKDRVAQIVTFGTMAARGAVRDVGRVYGIPYGDVDKLAKLIPLELGMTLERALKVSSNLRQLVAQDPALGQVLDTARILEGLPRHVSVHAAGIVISREPLTAYVPLQRTSDGVVTTQFPWETIEELGLLKMDFLGLRTLTVIQNTLKIIRVTQGIVIDPRNIPAEDQNTYAMLQQGNTSGVFQLESAGMRTLIKDLQPSSLNDIVALVALYRPGPLGSGMVEDYIARKHQRKQVEYLHPTLEPILKETYGIILYQEQVMQIASQLAGFSLGEADILRRAMGKKKPEVIAALREQFLQGAVKRKIPTKIAGEIFDLMAHFAGYGFNKSHSAAYAVIAYQTAYLKANYPVEYMAALLTSVMENTDKVALYIDECRRLGIEILPPDVNESLTDFTVVGRKIRFGLAAVKNVGKGAIENIIATREEGGSFTSFQDFCNRVDLRVVNKRVIESLIKCGAFGSVGELRARLLAGLDQVLDVAQQLQREKLTGQYSLFEFFTEEMDPIGAELPQIPEFPPEQLLALEKETVGLYISGHPLARYATFLREQTVSSKELQDFADGAKVTLAGVYSAGKQILTKNGQQMLFATIEDLTGTYEVVIFPRLYEQSRSLLTEDALLLVKGEVNWQETEVKVIAEQITELNTSHLDAAKKALYVRLSSRQAKQSMNQVLRLLTKFPGPHPVFLYFQKEKSLHRVPNLTVELQSELMNELKTILGPAEAAVKDLSG